MVNSFPVDDTDGCQRDAVWKSDYEALAAELADSRLIAREQEDAHIAANLRNTHLQERISQLEAFLNRCYEGHRAPYAEEMDNEHIPMPTPSETPT
ncbi:MAG TPA: hypothetical protein VN879_15970 [Candidatus Acidoferrales bacterium]|nr:hypothetical protein [Candidatus Acidoferrales bacterium]